MTREKKPTEKPKIKPKGNAFTPEEKTNIIQAVEKYMLLGYDLKKASIMARVSYSTVYMWYKADDSLRIKLDAAKWSVNSKARHNLIKSVNSGDLQTSKYWLEKRDPDFINKQIKIHKDVNPSNDVLNFFKNEKINDETEMPEEIKEKM